MEIKDFFDTKINIVKKEQVDKDELLKPFNNESPIVDFNNVLKKTRSLSNKSENVLDEMKVMNYFKEQLSEYAIKYQLDSNYFLINNSGPILVVKTKQGQHYIKPTHFERGAYFSSPHFDHELNYSATQVPKIKIGKYTRFGQNSAVNVGANITIGDCVWLAPGSILLRQEHDAYGQPSIGARTVSMTNQPSIKIADFAWVGRDVIVGWSAGYIGKASIVGARSFINKWVGDYSIVGDHSKILKYLPFKAYLFEYFAPTLEDVLRISDWQRVEKQWTIFYKQHAEDYEKGFLES
ncbi:acyltransferase [Leuconostoc citreum]|uniref:acyltransferase n=1 Tax=Leuconostoc citreum TaxID=33964 RepID=UPI0032DE818F